MRNKIVMNSQHKTKAKLGQSEEKKKLEEEIEEARKREAERERG
jgi:hypothetical protein